MWPSGTGQASPPIHPLTSLQRAVFLVNSRLGSFAAASRNKCSTCRSYPEVTTAVLPSSLSIIISFTLVFSTNLRVLDYGTVTYTLAHRGFSRYPNIVGATKHVYRSRILYITKLALKGSGFTWSPKLVFVAQVIKSLLYPDMSPLRKIYVVQEY
jgi:hypothetical protein